MNIVGRAHGAVVHKQRTRVLSEQLGGMIPTGARVLDVGCGDGLLGNFISRQRPDLRMEGIDVLVRDQAHIPVRKFDGYVIPYETDSFDVVTFIDVLHHTTDPMILLAEATRVARGVIIIKDHLRNGLFAGPTLKLMDWVGNAHHGVALPYNYWPRQNWIAAFDRLGLRVTSWNEKLGLYAAPANWIFGRSLHFIAKLSAG